MNDETHVRLVDAHAEGDRRHRDHAFVLQEAILRLVAQPLFQAGMIGDGGMALGVEKGR